MKLREFYIIDRPNTHRAYHRKEIAESIAYNNEKIITLREVPDTNCAHSYDLIYSCIHCGKPEFHYGKAMLDEQPKE